MPKKPAISAPALPFSALEAARSAAARAQAQVDRIANDPRAKNVDRARAETSLNAAVKMFAALSGETELTAATILRSKHWLRLMQTVGDALEPFPGALEAVAKALEAVEALH